MSLQVDSFLDRVRTPTYECADFAREVWLVAFGEDRGAFLCGKLSRSTVAAFQRIPEPIEPCFVLFQRKGHTPHVGILCDGRVLHLAKQALWQPFFMVARKFTRVSYFL